MNDIDQQLISQYLRNPHGDKDKKSRIKEVNEMTQLEFNFDFGNAEQELSDAITLIEQGFVDEALEMLLEIQSNIQSS